MWWGRLVIMSAAAAAHGAAAAQTIPPAHETVIVHGKTSCSAEQPDGTRALSFDCLNAQLSDGEGASPQTPDLKALDAIGRGNPEQLGTFSYTATQIRMGSAFGKSVKPERPPATITSSVLLPRGK